ncbi:response regulator [Pararobbsia alpina]|uniref:response regulator n=1 Tax=Pararobbsia alpina TaxID=621374 RepID=UPI0039A626C1
MNPPHTLRVLLVEDDERLREEFERMVDAQPELHLVGSVGTVADARRALLTARPDVAIIDLGLPDGDGAELIGLLRQTAPSVSVLVSTIFGDEAHVIHAIQAGARGYLLKDTSADEFLRSIRMVHEGDAPLSPQIARHLLARFAPPERSRVTSAADTDALTAREIDILKRISQGFSVAETARLINISPHTVTSHIKNIYGKLAVHNRVEAVNVARTKGLIR